MSGVHVKSNLFGYDPTEVKMDAFFRNPADRKFISQNNLLRKLLVMRFLADPHLLEKMKQKIKESRSRFAPHIASANIDEYGDNNHWHREIDQILFSLAKENNFDQETVEKFLIQGLCALIKDDPYNNRSQGKEQKRRIIKEVIEEFDMAKYLTDEIQKELEIQIKKLSPELQQRLAYYTSTATMAIRDEDTGDTLEILRTGAENPPNPQFISSEDRIHPLH